ncbi:MAG: exonuclease SbcC [Alteromonadaceae bacterium]|jgi:exonuclease SbcC
MIFSKFFKAKWQSKDSNIRIGAINDELQINNPEQRDILQQLLEQDNHELVRRAALLKLNSFFVWLDASKNNNNKKIREFSLKQTQQILTGQHDIKLSLKEKLEYIEQLKTTTGLESWLQEEQNPDLIIALYEKIAKPLLIQNLFIKKQNEQVQVYLLDFVDTTNVLDKLAKHVSNDKVSLLITEKLAALITLSEKPKKLTKQVQLLLSKLLALTDLTDYEMMIIKKEQLQDEWQGAVIDFDCFSEKEQATFKDKYLQINLKLDKIFVAKAEAYQQHLIENKLSQEKNNASDTFTKAVSRLSQSLATSIFENVDIDQGSFQQSLNSLKNDVVNSVLNDKEKLHFQHLIDFQLQRLNQLPVIAQSVTEATHLISKISQLALPTTIAELNERQPVYKDWLSQWQAVEKQAFGALPESIVNAYQEIALLWRKGLNELISQQKALFIQCQKKSQDVNGLIARGKYNAAFGVFKRVESLFVQLSENQQQRLQRDYDSISEKIAELSDWEHYIATPRKTSLLAEVKALVMTPLDNPNEQAAKVKQCRTTWNSLGHADDDVEKALNDEFNQACEQAFAPCRQYYGEQEKLREQHLATRLAIIDEAKTFALLLDNVTNNLVNNETKDWKSVDGQLNKLQQKWQDAGEVEREKYKSLYHQFKAILAPVKHTIKAFHDENTRLKRLLIDQASQALLKDDVFGAIQEVKELQNKWRTIGYAGPRQENRLWQEFRHINDSLFKKRDEAKKSEDASQQERLQTYQDQLEQLKVALPSGAEMAELQNAKSLAEQLLNEIVESKPVVKSVYNAIESFIKEINSDIKVFNEQKIQLDWQHVFHLLRHIAKADVDKNNMLTNESYMTLSASWQKRLLDVIKSEETSLRALKTLELEIFAGIESPSELKQERMKVQVDLMQHQMLSGATVDLQKSFMSWLQLGTFTQNDVAFIERIEPIYCR